MPEIPEALRAELEDILTRRGNVEPPFYNAGEVVDNDAVRKGLVGLALSGGGVRSASFNLGLLQALFRYGLLRHVDYLSTVSGGGYVGGWFSSLFAPPAARAGAPARARLARTNETLNAELGPNPNGPQTGRVRAFVRGGDYLNRPLPLLNHYLIGLFLNNLAIFGGIVFLCTLAAIVWRWLDTAPLSDWLLNNSPGRLPGWLKIQEWNRPFLPAAVFSSLWLLAWALTYLFARTRPRDRAGPAVLHGLLLLTFLCLFVGAAVWISTPSIRVHNPVDGVADGKALVTYAQSRPQQMAFSSVVGLVAAALLPLLRPKKLVEGWLRPTQWYQPYLFLIAGTALLLGLPFLLICWIAKHDFSGSFDRRSPHLSQDGIHYSRWREFWAQVREGAKSERESCLRAGRAPSGPNFFIWNWVGAADTERWVLGVRAVGLLSSPLEGPLLAATVTVSERTRFEAPNDFTTRAQGDDWLNQFETSPTPRDRGLRAYKRYALDVLNDRVIDSGLNRAGPPAPPFYSFALKGGEDGWLGALIDHHQERDRIRYLILRAKQRALLYPEERELNRLLLEACYPVDVWEKSIVRRQALVPWDIHKLEDIHQPESDQDLTPLIRKDQARRARWLLGSFSVFFFAALLVNLNRTSLQSYYRARLREAFLTPDGRGGLRLSECDPTARGAPYHLFNASVVRMRGLREWLFGVSPPAEPSPEEGLPTEGFLLSRRFCGLGTAGYRGTAGYDDLSVDDAMAVSAAAFSPVVVHQPLFIFLMAVLNLRLGQWLPNPRLPGRPGPPTAFRLLVDLWRRPCYRNHVYVTDGGHHENLGLGPLLDRRCRVLIVSDAGYDPHYAFDDLLRLFRRSRLEGVRLLGGTAEGAPALPLGLLRPSAGRGEHQAAAPPGAGGTGARDRRPAEGARHYLLAQVAYPDGADGLLVYLKPNLTGDEDNDLVGYALAHGDFPHDPPADQLYDPDRVESYRQLGYHIGETLCRDLERAWDRPLGDEHLWAEPFRLAVALDDLADQRHWEQSWGPRPGADTLRVVLRREDTASGRSGTVVVTDGLGEEELRGLRRELDEAGFFDLPRRLGASEGAAVLLEVTVAAPEGRHTVRLPLPYPSEARQPLRLLLSGLLKAAGWAAPAAR